MVPGGVLFSRTVSSQVLSALRGLTSVFGMGTGGTLSPSSPESSQDPFSCASLASASAPRSLRSVFTRLKNRTVKADLNQLNRYSSSFPALRFFASALPLRTAYPAWSSSRPISIGKLPHCCAFTADLSPDRLSGVFCIAAWNLLLEVGFTLRCLQRLSAPHFASQLCRWHDNCCTRDASTPVLSYWEQLLS